MSKRLRPTTDGPVKPVRGTYSTIARLGHILHKARLSASQSILAPRCPTSPNPSLRKIDWFYLFRLITRWKCPNKYQDS